jgi:hypothetical protein
MLILRRKYREAAEIHKIFAENSQKMLDELSKLEHNRERCAEKASDAFGRLLSAAGEYADGEVNQRIAKNLLYCIGKIIYILDAYDDLEDDRKHGRYNPLTEGSEGLRETLTRLIAEAAADFELLPENAFHSILENIFYLGLHNTTDQVLNRKRTEND